MRRLSHSRPLALWADRDSMTLAVGIKPEIRASSATDMPPDYPPAAIRLLAGEGNDEYVLTECRMKGQRGFFTRNQDGAVVGIDLAGRATLRVDDAARK